MTEIITFSAQSLGDRLFKRDTKEYNGVLVGPEYKSPPDLSVASDEYIAGYDFVVSRPLKNIEEEIILTQEYLLLNKFKDVEIDGLVKTTASVICEGNSNRGTTITAVGFKLMTRTKTNKDKVFYEGIYRFRIPLLSYGSGEAVSASYEDHVLNLQVDSSEHIIMQVNVYGYVDHGNVVYEDCIVGILHPRGLTATHMTLPLNDGIIVDEKCEVVKGEHTGRKFTLNGSTQDKYSTILKWNCEAYERKTIHLLNADPTNSLDYKVTTYARKEGVPYPEIVETALVAGDTKQVVLNNVYDQVVIEVKSTTSGSAAKYKLDTIGLNPGR